MPRRSHDVGEHRRSRSSRARRYGGGMAIAGSAAGALWALGMSSATAPQAHADLEDLIIQPVIDAIGQAVSAVDPGLLSALDSTFDVGSFASALDPSLDLSSLPTHALADVGSAAATSSNVGLSEVGITEPITDVSVNGGAETPVLVDTGSNGLVIPIQDIGWQTLSFPTGLGFGSYSGGLDYFYLTFDMPVSFDGVVSTDTPVDVALFEFPTNFESFLGGSGDGILGIGPDSVGPGPGVDLPSGYTDGVYINEAANTIEFGANPDGTGVTTLAGAPISEAFVSINGGNPVEVSTDFDSGGVYGAIPESALAGSGVTADSAGTLPAGTEIQVYADADGSPGAMLYEYDTTATNAPTVVSSGDFDTGSEPFLQGPIYIDTSGSGQTVFDYQPTMAYL
jgi:hypothetical protein